MNWVDSTPVLSSPLLHFHYVYDFNFIIKINIMTLYLLLCSLNNFHSPTFKQHALTANYVR